MTTNDSYTCLTCFNDFELQDGKVTIDSDTFHEFTCNNCLPNA